MQQFIRSHMSDRRQRIAADSTFILVAQVLALLLGAAFVAGRCQTGPTVLAKVMPPH
jgi:hypothetical protein